MIIYGLLCSLLCRIKGGGILYRIRPDHGIINNILDGKIVSSLGYGALVMSASSPLTGALAGLGWLIWMAPGVGDYIGALGGAFGRWREAALLEHWLIDWMLPKTPWIYGWLGTALRGAVFAIPLALALGSWYIIIAGAMMPVCYWLGITIRQVEQGVIAANWLYGEYLWGAVIGLATWGALHG